ncbi:cytochrome P450 [Auricularia subglabra TFB-10046 SS5]|nr:cytochrome P450 [Auricularia subglabra TFB-10046 SS5]
MYDTFLLPFVCAAVLASVVFYSCRRGRGSLPLPPGPAPRPIVGNIADLPTDQEWVAYTRMAKGYGEFFIGPAECMWTHIIVLNSLEAAMDLLDKRGEIYSDRPQTTMLHKLAWSPGLMPYGECWRAHRRVLHHFLNEGAAKKYRDMQLRNSRVLMQSLLDDPHNFWHQIHRFSAMNIMSLAYGIDVAPKDDPWMHMADVSINCISGAGLPGSYAVDWCPILQYLPDWLPGMGFKRQAREWKELSMRLPNLPLAKVKNDIASGTQTVASMVAELLEHGLGGRAVPEAVIRNSSAAVYLVLLQSTAILHSFVLMMVLFPEKQRSAQAEIERVIGVDRLPDYGDLDSLPYIRAIVFEVYRLFPVAPLNLPRRVMVDDEYHGMRIPKGATVITNIWAISRDEAIYPNADQFLPERFLNSDGSLNKSVKDPRGITFGFGRRACSGIHVADASVWIVAFKEDMMLACFDIEPSKDAAGREVLPKVEMCSGLVTSQAPFQCEIAPRSEAAKQLVQTATVAE